MELIYRNQTKFSKDFHVPSTVKFENILLNCIGFWFGFIVLLDSGKETVIANAGKLALTV